MQPADADADVVTRDTDPESDTGAGREAQMPRYRIPVDAPTDARMTVAEVLCLAATCLVGLVALVSLAAAHLHHHTPAIVGAGSAVLVAVVLGAVLVADRPSIRLDPIGLVPVVLGAGFAAVMMFPGFHYGTGDRDPGAYVEHAAAISRTHSISFPDDLLAAGLPALQAPGAAWPALWTEPGNPATIFPQFYHLWPALLATAKDTGGWTGLFATPPLVGVIAVAAAVCIGRRLAGWPGAWAVAALLSSNMLEVWQAKYPSSEIFAQMLFVGATLGIVLAIQTGWRSAAALAGILVGLSYLERPDGLVVVLLTWAGLCALLAARRFDARAGWFAAGLLVLLPYGFVQGYHLARAYTLDNDVPSLPKVLAVMVALAVVGAVLAWQRSLVQGIVRWGSGRRVRVTLAAAFVVACGVLALVGGLRPRLLGTDYNVRNGVHIRTYDELSLIRLSWFFSLWGLALLGAGIVYLSFRRWRLDSWLVVLPAVVLLILYCYHVRNSPYLMWATRRFVPTVVAGMVLLIGCGVALVVVVVRRYLPEVVAAVAAVAIIAGLAVFFVSESAPLRHHDENGGSVEVVQLIAAVDGDQRGVFVWQDSNYCCNAPWALFGGPLLAAAGESSALLPLPDAAVAAVLTKYVAYAKSSGRPLFYIGDRTGRPPALPGMTSTAVKRLAGVLPHWQETFISRPKKTSYYAYDMTIYRLQPV